MKPAPPIAHQASAEISCGLLPAAASRSTASSPTPNTVSTMCITRAAKTPQAMAAA
jgi:hypothetical protein